MIQGAAATLGLIAGLVGMMTVMSRLVAQGRIHPEVSRKALHVGMGLSCLALPWVFPEPLWFAIGFTLVLATLAAVRYVPKRILPSFRGLEIFGDQSNFDAQRQQCWILWIDFDGSFDSIKGAGQIIT